MHCIVVNDLRVRTDNGGKLETLYDFYDASQKFRSEIYNSAPDSSSQNRMFEDTNGDIKASLCSL